MRLALFPKIRPVQVSRPIPPKGDYSAALKCVNLEALDAINWLLERAKSVDAIRKRRAGIELSTDRWGFSHVWAEVQDECRTAETLYEMLLLRTSEIRDIKEKVKPSLQTIVELEKFSRDPLTSAIIIESSRLSLIDSGNSGSYFIFDEENQPIFVIKPIDEDIGAINNPKGLASPFKASKIRRGLPLYLSVFREVATYRVAQLIGVSAVAPKTTLGVIQSDRFYDLYSQVNDEERLRYSTLIGPADLDKLCSVQTAIPQSKPLFEAIQDLQMAGLSDEEIERAFDPQDFEEANLLLWTTGDKDGHSGNFLVYPKSCDAIGNQILGIKKIDNGMAFGEDNHGFSNGLRYLPNAKAPLSQATLKKIERMNTQAIAKILRDNGLEGAIEAMTARVETLQRLVKADPSMTIADINREIYAKSI